VTGDGLADLLGRSVRLVPADLRLAVVAGVYLDERQERVVGLRVSGRDGRPRFLPWVGCELGADDVRVRSAFLLVETGEVDPYLRRGARLLRTRGELAELDVVCGGRVQRPAPRGGVSAVLATGTSLA
jgi:hypothetical protein